VTSLSLPLLVCTMAALLAACGDESNAPPPPPLERACLARTGPAIIVRGVQTSGFADTSLAANTKVDASAAQFLTSTDIPISIGGGGGVCLRGGEVIGALSPSTSFNRLHDTYGLVARGRAFTLEQLRVFDYGDGASMDRQSAADWIVRDVHFKYIRDDCVENDFLNSGTIESSLFDGCYDAFSARPYTSTSDGSGNLVVVRNSLVRLQHMDQGYLRAGHGGFWKWSPTSPMISLYANVFLTDGPTIENDVLAPPPGKLKDCSDNVMIWLGSGPFPETLPSCFTLLTGVAGLEYWNDAVAQWKADHPTALPDVGPPIVSLLAPPDSATVSGTVTLIATAVDDRDVAGVQFLLNGQPIGPEVTTESPLTRFALWWDSRSHLNGTYQLAATARDSRGNTMASAPITVIIGN